MQRVPRQPDAAFHVKARQVHADFVPFPAVREIEHQHIPVPDGGEALHPPGLRLRPVLQEIEISVHPRPETQLIDQNEIPRYDGRLHGIAGDGIEIHYKQPERRCNQQRNDNDGDVLQQGFDELFHNTGYFSSKIFFLYNSHICELVAGFPMPTTRFAESKRNVLYCGLKEKLFFLSMMPRES